MLEYYIITEVDVYSVCTCTCTYYYKAVLYSNIFTFLFHMCIIRTHGVTISGRLNAFSGIVIWIYHT